MGRKLRSTTYHVSNIDSAVRFYTETLGGRLVKQLPWGLAFIDIDGQGGMINLFSIDTYRAEVPNSRGFPGPKVILAVENLDQEREQLEVKGVRLSETLGETGDIRGFEAFDEDGNVVFFFEGTEGLTHA